MSGTPAAGRAVRVLVADDEPLARKRVLDLLSRYPDVEVVGTADSGPAAVAAIENARPDVVFLDIQMPGRTGLDVVRDVGPARMPATVFVTAYDQYATQAFDVAAVDYLVKPYDDERFAEAFARARRALDVRELEALRARLQALLDATGGAPAHTPPPGGYLERIAVEMKGKLRVVPVQDIAYIGASGPYAEIHTADRTYVIRESMQTLEERLDPRRFTRIHRSVIVRVDLIDALHRASGGDYEVQLKNGTRLRVSRSRREALERLLGVVG